MAELYDDAKFIKSVGGKFRYRGGEEHVNFGWLEPQDRTSEQEEEVDKALGDMAVFQIVGKSAIGDDLDILLTNLWTTQQVVAALGFAFPGIHQITGSCVGAGGGNMGFTTTAVEVIRLGEPEKLFIPFWLLPYGRSRFYLGDRNPGEGSTGVTFAKAIKEDGWLDAKIPGMPSFQQSEGLVWGKATELAWSDGDAQQTLTLLPESRKHTIKTASRLRSANQVWDAVGNLYSCTCAHAKHISRASIQDGVTLGRLDRNGGHQTSILARKMHPKLGRLFGNVNQWGHRVYPKDPAGLPLGSTWMLESDMEEMCRNGEVIAFSGQVGYPAATDELVPLIVPLI